MEHGLHPPAALQLTGNVAENWKKFKQRFELYLSAIGGDNKSDKVKASVFLHVIGDEALEVYNNFMFNDEADKLKLAKIKEQFEAYCIPKSNVTFERHRFFTCAQKTGETIDQYVNELRNRSKTCEFGGLTESLIKDRIVCGILDNSLRERMLRDPELDLQKAISMCRAAETVKTQAKELISDMTGNVDAIRKEKKGAHKPFKKYSSEKNVGQHNANTQSNQKTCQRCATQHPPRQCPAYGKKCNNCQKDNHFARCCKSSSQKGKVEVVDGGQDEFYVEAVSKNNSHETDWITTLQVNDTYLKFKLDTGANVNVISESDFKKIRPRPKLHTATMKLTAYAGSNIPQKGKCLLKVTHKDVTSVMSFVVVPKDVQALLGCQACERLNLVKRVFVIEQTKDSVYEDIMKDYSDLFQGLGCLPGEHTIRVDKTVPPVIHPCRKVPFALLKPLKEELDRMEKMDVIKRIDEPTEWVSSLVVVDKKNGKLRVCLDPRDLNRAIKREHFRLPTREDIMSQFANAKYFSKLDASSGFWQMKLDDSSSRLCTFNSPFGRYRFLRLPFGISSAPEVYHKAINMIYEHLDGVDTSMDDIIIWATTKSEHDKRLKAVLDATRKANLKLNRDKCQFGVTELTFVGDIVSSEGVRPDPRKVSAIKNMPRPQNKKDVQRFNGMVTYMGKFIPNLSEKMAPLRQLTEKNVEWEWNHEHENAWAELKTLLTQAPVLKFYDPARPIKISSDASQSGLGAVLLQKFDDWQPVAYASRAMLDEETRYAQIEKELLSILYACERFHQFVAGQAVSVETDHKPLIALFRKSLNDCPLRIQRMMIRLQRYSLDVAYTPGKLMYTADALSRAVDPKETVDTKCNSDVNAYVHMVTSALPVADAKMELIRHETINDNTLACLKNAIRNGWPDVKQNCSPDINEYWNYRADLSEVDDIIYKGSKIIIPKSMRTEMLKQIHKGHLGVEKCKKRAREVMFWPKINQDVSNEVLNCATCQKYQVSQPAQPLQPHQPTARPYQKIGADLFTCQGKDYLIMTDYYSLYPEVCKLQSTTAEAVITCMKATFARHGVASEVFTDNGPQFSSEKFRNFAKQWDFIHATSSPHFPQSNGLVEKSVQTVKRLMHKATDSGSDFYQSLLIYRTTPLDCGMSPSQLLMGRRLRSNLPMSECLLSTKEGEKVKEFKSRQKEKQKFYYDRGTKDLPELHPGDKVRFKDGTSTWAQKGTVLRKVQPRSYRIRTEDGAVLRRNRRDLLTTPVTVNQGTDAAECDEIPCNPSETNLQTDSQLVRKSLRQGNPPERLIETI